MMFQLEKSVDVVSTSFMNKHYFIITTHKSPKEWAELLGSKVLVTASLDRLLYKCEVIKLTGKGYQLNIIQPSSNKSNWQNEVPSMEIGIYNIKKIVANYFKIT